MSEEARYWVRLSIIAAILLLVLIAFVYDAGHPSKKPDEAISKLLTD